jgi:DUF2892 family protein
MSAQPNIAGLTRFVYVAAGAAAAGWGLWGADQGWTQWLWLGLGGALAVLGIIGYSPLRGFGAKNHKAD